MKKFNLKELKPPRVNRFYNIIILSCFLGILAPLVKLLISLKHYNGIYEKLNSILYLPKINSVIVNIISFIPDWFIGRKWRCLLWELCV